MQPISFKREVLNVLLRVGAVVFTIVLLIIVVNFSYSSFGMISDGECNIAVMPIEGVILPFSGITATDELYITPATLSKQPMKSLELKELCLKSTLLAERQLLRKQLLRI